MIDRKKFVSHGGLLSLGILLFIVILTLLAFVGRAFAGTGAPVDDPASMIAQLYEFMRTGRGTMAVGIANLLVVWVLRNLLAKKISWFGTMLGGYVLGFGTAALEYVGVALYSEASITLGLFLNAVGAGFTASGGWEALRDVLTAARKPPKIAAVTMLLIVAGLCVAPGCGPISPKPAVAAAIDCVSAERERVDALLNEFVPLVMGGSANWSVIYQRAKQAGASIGGCFLGELVNAYLGGRRAPESVDESWTARLTLEKFRQEELRGATLHTKQGDL